MRTTLRYVGLIALVFGFLGLSLPHTVLSESGDWITFVSDGGIPWTNWDIYLRNIETDETIRLTYDPAIDNHPDFHMGKQWVVFSSRTGGLPGSSISILEI